MLRGSRDGNIGQSVGWLVGWSVGPLRLSWLFQHLQDRLL